MRPIKDAVHSDLEASRAVYDWVAKLCVSLGANARAIMVPFEKYANAAELSLLTPSSAARALANGAPNIERVDRLVQTIARAKGHAPRRTRSRPSSWWTAGWRRIAKKRDVQRWSG